MVQANLRGVNLDTDMLGSISLRRWILRSIRWVWRIPKTRRLQRLCKSILGGEHGAVPEGVNPFIVLASPRSGSYLLLERLSSQWKDIRSYGEILNPKIYGERTLDEAIRQSYFADLGYRFVGSKILFNQVTRERLSTLLALPRMKVIILRRDNLVRQFVSFAIAMRDRIWKLDVQSDNVDDQNRAIKVDVKELLEYRARRDEGYRRFERMVADLPIFHVLYEEMVENLDPTIRAIGEFLGAGAPNRAVPTAMRRQNPEPLAELIVNFAELRQALVRGGHDDLVAQLVA